MINPWIYEIMKSEDLSKDLQVNPRISPQTVKDFMMNWMKKLEIKRRDWPNTDRSVLRSVAQLRDQQDQQELGDGQQVHLVTLQVRCKHLPVGRFYNVVILHDPLLMTGSPWRLKLSFSSLQSHQLCQLASNGQTSCGSENGTIMSSTSMNDMAETKCHEWQVAEKLN